MVGYSLSKSAKSPISKDIGSQNPDVLRSCTLSYVPAPVEAALGTEKDSCASSGRPKINHNVCAMNKEELIARSSLKAAGKRVGIDVQMIDGQLVCRAIDPDDPRYTMDYVMPTMKMVEACRADDFDFFQPWLAAGHLTAEQMSRAVERYHLGKTRSGKPIFWMIDEMYEPLDAHIGSDAWISTMLKRRQPLLRYWRPNHCLFGLHLLCEAQEARQNTVCENDRAICVVESEQSTVILSELFPQCIWMAYASMSFLRVEYFAPLKGHSVTIYPPTDPSFFTFPFFETFAVAVRRRYGLRIAVASILEDRATNEQKARGIDLLDFIRENS